MLLLPRLALFRVACACAAWPARLALDDALSFTLLALALLDMVKRAPPPPLP